MKKVFIILFAFMTFWVGALELELKPVAKGNFTQRRYIAKAGRSLVSSGVFTMACGRGIVFDIQKPFVSRTIVTANKFVQISGDGIVSVIDGSENATFKNIAAIFSSIFSGDIEAIEANFHVVEEKGAKSTLTLIPNDDFLALVFEKLVITAGVTIERLEAFETGGNRVVYEFSDVVFPDKLTDYEENLFGY